MELFQVMLSSIFSLIGAGCILFIAARAYSVGSDLGEIKEILKDLRRTAQISNEALQEPGIPAPEPGDWPSVTDPAYNSPDPAKSFENPPYGLRPSEPRRSPVTTRPESW